MNAKKDILFRMYLMYALVCLFGVAILGQIVRLQFVEGEKWKARSEKFILKHKPIDASRGNIYSVDGSLLATSVPIYDVFLDSKCDGLSDETFNQEVSQLAYKLSGLFEDKSSAEYKKILVRNRNNGVRYWSLQKNISHHQLKELKTFPILKYGKFKGGLIVEQKTKRQKPFRLLAERTIGYTREGIQPVGLEGAYDEYLKGTGGVRLMQRLSGNAWKPVHTENEIDPKDGSDLVTTIDLNIQDVAENALYTQLAKHNSNKGCVIVMEVATGEIKAIANLTRKGPEHYEEDYNYAIGYSTEPGSTFKLPALMAGLEDKKFDINDSVDTHDGWIVYYGRTLKDTKGGKGVVSVKRAFELSSNVAVSKLIFDNYKSEPQQFIDRLHSFGLNSKLGLDIVGEGTPRIKNVKDRDWSGLSLPYMSIGYETQLTPLQTLTFYNAVANDGKMMKPMFVKEIRDKGKLIKKFEPVVVNPSIASAPTIKKAQEMLEGVVERGTATNLKFKEYKIAGKTGTAQMAYGKKGYDQDGSKQYQASFAGYFPAENPQYSCIVIVYNLSSKFYYGNLVAGPVFKEIANKVYATRIDMHDEVSGHYAQVEQGSPKVKNGDVNNLAGLFGGLELNYEMPSTHSGWVQTTNIDSVISVTDKPLGDKVIPSVIGMGMRDAIYVLESKGLEVIVKGKGRVVKQSLKKGSRYNPGQKITVELR
ncbi:MAG: transpeptidase family protein [Bacteroidia bacterium]|nr:transpeptidase family protein [Bacteroidia bacterium]NNC84545.1 transpeptidase family protein [Bacteroidia bacterium]NNM15306.1 transpeptidase family protein [Bacteroidia bacterium]